jgi:hypothetical protein
VPNAVQALFQTGSLADVQLAKLFQLLGLLALPAGLFLALVLYRLFRLLLLVWDLASLAQYDLLPTLQHVRGIAANAEGLSDKATLLAETLSKTAATGQQSATALWASVIRWQGLAQQKLSQWLGR